MSIRGALVLAFLTTAPLAALADGYPSGYSDTDLGTALAKAAQNGKPVLLYMSRSG